MTREDYEEEMGFPPEWVDEEKPDSVPFDPDDLADYFDRFPKEAAAFMRDYILFGNPGEVARAKSWAMEPDTDAPPFDDWVRDVFE